MTKMRLNILTIDHKKYVLIPFAEYRMMEQGVPPLPPRNARGNYPAVETTDALIARGIVRDREAVGMSQKDLAAAAGIQAAVLNRIERGIRLPAIRTLQKIEAALERAGLKRDPRPYDADAPKAPRRKGGGNA